MLNEKFRRWSSIPDLVEEKTLRQVIGELKPLTEFGEIDEEDIYHSFRVYPEHMRAWISDIKEGESAFDNVDDMQKATPSQEWKDCNQSAEKRR